jgi:hypothetical protein
MALRWHRLPQLRRSARRARTRQEWRCRKSKQKKRAWKTQARWRRKNSGKQVKRLVLA